MAESPNAVESAILHRAWIQWVALGVDAAVESDDAVVDLEALIVLTAALGDADARLRDVSTDWCVAYGRYVNGARLKQVAREIGTPAEAIGEYVATVAAAGGPKWPMATVPRPDYVGRGKARLETARSPARLVVRLRAAFGVNARADVLAALLAAPWKGTSIGDLARVTHFTKPNVAFAVDALLVAGLVEAQIVGNEKRVSLTRSAAILPGLRPPIAQPDWVTRFRLALRVLRFVRFAEARGLSSAVRAIEARTLLESELGVIAREDIPRPNLDTFGDEFSVAFDFWLTRLVDWLRRNSSSG